MTAPWEMEKKKMKPTSSQMRSDLVAVGRKMAATPASADGGADGADEEEGFAAELVDDGHGEEGGAEVHGAEQDGLLVAGELGEAGGGKNVVRVIEDGVDAGELVEHADGDGEENGQAVFALEKGLGLLRALEMDGVDDFVELGFADSGMPIISRTRAGLVNAILRDQPARAARDAEEQDGEEERGEGGDAELPAPGCGADR